MAIVQRQITGVESIVRNLDASLTENIGKYWESLRSSEAEENNGIGLGIIATALPLYCNPASIHYRNRDLVPLLESAADQFLATQHESGCISLHNCNIESPPDTAFTAHLAATVAQLGERFGTSDTFSVVERLLLFLKRAQPALLTGGIHTPNHRWVMASALAKMEELFGGTAFRDRAFQFLNEGLDVTEYGEWTERSNGTYNAVCAYYLYTVGTTFEYEPALEASRKTLEMMRYMLHPGDAIATEYSGRQDLNTVVRFDDRYYVTFHLYANHYQDAGLAEMARVAARTAPRGSLALIHHMLTPEKMTLPESGDQAPDRYTVLYGGDRTVPVPQDVWYGKKQFGHPFGASVLRHRRGKLSVTAMAGQGSILYVQYGKARMVGLKLAAGWFGAGAVSFPGIRRVSEDMYRADIVLKGCYFQPLPPELYRDADGVYVDMPNELRERSNYVELEVSVEFKLHDDGVDLRIVSGNRKNIYLQAVCMFDPAGQLVGDGLINAGPSLQRLTSGAAVYSAEGDWIRVEEGADEHKEAVMRNETVNRDAFNVAINLKTPTDRWIRIRCGHSAK